MLLVINITPITLPLLSLLTCISNSNSITQECTHTHAKLKALTQRLTFSLDTKVPKLDQLVFIGSLLKTDTTMCLTTQTNSSQPEATQSTLDLSSLRLMSLITL